jgi:anti-sigma regulatory factor (Ser/Thr protein kinase)
MCRVAATHLRMSCEAPREAREWIAGCLKRWEVEHLIEVVTLLTSELTTNALIHAGSGPTVSLTISDGQLEVGFADELPEPPDATQKDIAKAEVCRSIGRPVTHGRGLCLVEKLADEWGATDARDGKRVWFRLAVSEWPYLDACRWGPSSSRDSATVIANRGPWDS